ncbi:MAG TPA: thioredoxin family protein [Candidatus Cloacimonadota bacterium]|nr:thioredoxin family protein [Candidatus Cloacimonadota bacterium]
MRAALNLSLLMILFILAACNVKTDKASQEMQSEPVYTEAVAPETVETTSTETEKKATALPNPETSKPEVKATPPTPSEPAKPKDYQVYFLEIGSVNCIPCRMMQPIMKEIAEEYAGVVKVDFYDLQVDKEIGPKYGIRVMPTQVFLDANKKEFFRHEGFYPKAELTKMLDRYLEQK